MKLQRREIYTVVVLSQESVHEDQNGHNEDDDEEHVARIDKGPPLETVLQRRQVEDDVCGDRGQAEKDHDEGGRPRLRPDPQHDEARKDESQPYVIQRAFNLLHGFISNAWTGSRSG